jgi:hypothetical protein
MQQCIRKVEHVRKSSSLYSGIRVANWMVPNVIKTKLLVTLADLGGTIDLIKATGHLI